MKEEKVIKKQLRKNMLLNLLTFTIIFSVLGIIIYSYFRISLYQSADEELLNIKNRTGIMHKINGGKLPEIDKKDIEDGEEKEEKNKERIAPPNIDYSEKRNLSISENAQRPNEESSVNPRLIYIYRNQNGQIVEDKSSIINDSTFQNIEFSANTIDEVYEVTLNNQYKYRAINRKVSQNGENAYLQILINVDAENDIVESFRINLIICIVVSMVLSVVASYILSRKTLKPIILSWKKQTEFVQNASHELRTPLTIIQAKQELLLDEPQAKIIDKVEEINTSINETRRMARLVKDLMQLAKADSNKIELDKEATDIDGLISEITKPFTEMAEVQNKKFNLDLKYGKNISIDKNKIHQILVIILDNALKYTEADDEISVITYEKDSKCVIDIKDTGIGISDDGIEHIFDRFYREDKARSRETGGSGLGLSIASHIVELHGGTIKAMHNGNKGTIIEIKLK
ncbi:MAG: sensor histidine kinase [Clostridia bacterium]|nr:sensor histidine kinase [Clostridia bacterium]